MLIIILGLVILISLITDLKDKKILNIVTFPAMIFGLSYYLFNQGWDGLLFSGLGFLVGLMVFLIPYLLGGMGAGDVKLMAAIGALTGASFVFYSALITSIIGGFIAIVLIIKRRGITFSIKSLFFSIPFLSSNLGSMIVNSKDNSSISFPYGIAIFFGTIITFAWKGL
ncbi:prepilin peptidase [Aquibacillus halophilus]|uniref:Prepilin peptidase n=1 Tax=Aquibacillus halophilus TaxID=930132 RepID=A0A6A8DGF3_9BACI|nr:prepilin peptidase [Aquibacillus halophilus]